jgi:hypothetical protein
MLLVLDSCDHVVEAAASLAENLLKGAQGLNILATIDVYASLGSDSSKRANARPTNNWTAGNASASTAVNLREMSGPFSGARRCTHAPSGTRELATVRHLPQPGWDCTRDRTGGWPQAVALDPVSQSDCAYPYQLSAKPRPGKKGPRAGVNRSKAVPFPRPAFEHVRLDRRDERHCDFYSARHRESRGASVERRPRLPPCFPTSRARANSSPTRSAGSRRSAWSHLRGA